MSPAPPEPSAATGGRDPAPADPERLLRALELALQAEAAAGIDAVPVPAGRRQPRAGATQDAGAALAALQAAVAACTRCGLCRSRTHTVFGEGSAAPRLLFIGEGPGGEEDRTGRPFVGPAGRLLDRIIAAARLRREEVYIANIVKCRPPGNRTPTPDEVEACLPYLREQIRLLRPAVICTLGAPATRSILATAQGITRLRGQAFAFPEDPSIVVIPTYHPAYLLRAPERKRETWQDIQRVMRELDRARPDRDRA
ncbi:MAG: uracil-DNA glycosylase [Planctomycetes bacterium]|nr:uracil-DNA glycosylase [Planctomycetota bacterium]